MHTFQYPVFLFSGEFPDVTIKDHSERIPAYNLPSAGLAVRRKPCGKASQFRNDTAIIAGYQGENSSDRKAAFESLGEIPAGEEFGDLPVGRGFAIFYGRLEQPGPQYMTEGRLIVAGDPLQPKVFGILFIVEQNVPRASGEELDGAKPARGVQQFGFRDVQASICRLMFGVVFVDEPFAGQLERFLPGFRPGRPVRNRLREHQ